MFYLLIWHYNLKIFLTETQYNVKGKMMSCFLALMALDIDEIKPLLKKGANLTLADRGATSHSNTIKLTTRNNVKPWLSIFGPNFQLSRVFLAFVWENLACIFEHIWNCGTIIYQNNNEYPLQTIQPYLWWIAIWVLDSSTASLSTLSTTRSDGHNVTDTVSAALPR